MALSSRSIVCRGCFAIVKQGISDLPGNTTKMESQHFQTKFFQNTLGFRGVFCSDLV